MLGGVLWTRESSTAATEEGGGYRQEGQFRKDSAVPGSYGRARGGGESTAREGGRRGV
jgi:hypothetical protein